MTDHIQGKLNPIPPLKGNGVMMLADVIGKSGADTIANSGQIIFHVAGDTGVPEIDQETRQVMVTEAMQKDYDISHPENSPAFFLHLGDVIYGPNPNSFLDQFYRPYMHYQGKIIAIPGNHDGESAAKMTAFQKYFCAPSQSVPPIAGSIYRETMNQPGVYWLLDAPFVHIVGLYSNTAENPGYISGNQIGQKQKDWLVKTLTSIKAQRDKGNKKGLIIATHHPPFSGGGHSGSTQMLADIDDACQKANIYPHAFFSGHAHSIQRYMRTVQSSSITDPIPYVITGCGGHGGQSVNPATPNQKGNPVYAFSKAGWGYTKVQINSTNLRITSYGVDWDQHRNPVITQVDTVSVKI